MAKSAFLSLPPSFFIDANMGSFRLCDSKKNIVNSYRYVYSNLIQHDPFP